jgi:hypothetical protein
MNALKQLRRLGKMDLQEIRFRTGRMLQSKKEHLLLTWDRQFFEKSPWWEAWNSQKVSDGVLRSALESADGGEAASLLPGYIARRNTVAFFWDLPERQLIAERLQVSFGGYAAAVRRSADGIVGHRFKIFGYPEVNYGPKISWRRDPIHDVESELKHFASLAPLDLQSVGDSKNVWEVSRHQHFITLGEAYLLTKDERYAEECLAQWEDWLLENPYLCGINWASSLEVAFRSWSWVWMLYLLLGSRALTGHRIGLVGQALARNATFITENLSTYFAANTHLLGEAFALFVIGVLFPELHGAETWRQCGRAILIEEMQKQVCDDGSHFEQSTFYHRYAVEFLLCAAILADRNGCPFPESYRFRLEKMLEFLVHTIRPSGLHPSIGDSDGGRLLPFGPFEAEDHRPILSTGAVYFGRAGFRKYVNAVHEQSLWLLGADACGSFENLAGEETVETSRTFAAAGLVTMRSDWTENARLMIFDAGTQGIMHAGHGHADSLSLICSANGSDWLVDPGTYVYSVSRPWRDHFRSTAAHNTIAIDNCDQACATDWFKWEELPRVNLEKSLSQFGLDYAVGSHTGYSRLAKPVNHRRHVIFLKSEYWLVSDELSGTGEHQIESFFHFAPGVSLSLSDNGCVATRGNKRFLVLPIAPGTRFRVAKGEESPIQGWYSRDYGHREPASVLIGRTQADMPVRLHWLLWPLAGEPEFQRLSADGPSFMVRSELWTDYVLLENSSAGENNGEIASSALVAALRRGASGEIERLDLLGGGSVWSRGESILLSDSFEAFSARWTADVLTIEARPLQPFRLRSSSVVKVLINRRPSKLTRDGDLLIFSGDS